MDSGVTPEELSYFVGLGRRPNRIIAHFTCEDCKTPIEITLTELAA
jgi:hypothetical protein